MTIIQFLDGLIEKTQNASIKWEDEGNSYRLVLLSGSVLFKAVYNANTENFDFVMKVFDGAQEFASYYCDLEDSYNEEMYNRFSDLLNAINEQKTKIINSKLDKLYADLATPELPL